MINQVHNHHNGVQKGDKDQRQYRNAAATILTIGIVLKLGGTFLINTCRQMQVESPGLLVLLSPEMCLCLFGGIWHSLMATRRVSPLPRGMGV